MPRSVPKPKALQPGDTLRIVSPASPLDSDKIERAIGILESEGYRVEVAPHALDRDAYLAGRDQDRARDLMDAFGDPSVDAVYCSRGGYGCARLFPHLDLPKIAASGKLFLGFSDITTLHIALNNLGMATVHAPMAFTLGFDREPWVYESFLRTLKGDLNQPDAAPKGRALVGGVGEGEVVGGCLCLITDSIGTPSSIHLRDRILLVEDVDENPHRIDAMLTHLLNANVLEGCQGIAIGEMTRSDEKVDEGIGGKPWLEIVRDRLAPLGLPLMVGLPFGHMKNMLTLPLGIRARMDADAGTLTYTESLCA